MRPGGCWLEAWTVRRRVPVFFLLALISVAAVVLILHRVGFEGTLNALGRAGPLAFLAMFSLSVLWLVCQALAWDRLGRPVGHRVPFRSLFGAVLVGFVGNYLTPSMYVGGEPMRVAYVGYRRRLPYYQVAGTVLLSKYLEFMAFVLLVCAGTGVALVHYWEDLADPAYRWVRLVMAAGAAVLLTVLVLLVVALRGRHRPISAVVEWSIRRRLVRRWLRRRRRRIRQMEDQIIATFNREGVSAWSAFAFLCLGFATAFVRPLVFFYFLKDDSSVFSFPELCLIFTLTQFVLAMQFTPGSLGAYEGGMIGIFAILEHSDVHALAYVMCLRVAEGLVVLLGLLAAMRQGIRVLASARTSAGPPEGLGSEEAVGTAADLGPPGHDPGGVTPQPGPQGTGDSTPRSLGDGEVHPAVSWGPGNGTAEQDRPWHPAPPAGKTDS